MTRVLGICGLLLVVLLVVFGSVLLVAPGVVAKEPIPSSRLSWVDTEDGLARCYYSNLSANWAGCVRK